MTQGRGNDASVESINKATKGGHEGDDEKSSLSHICIKSSAATVVGKNEKEMKSLATLDLGICSIHITWFEIAKEAFSWGRKGRSWGKTGDPTT